jgi:hypothetical protein
MTVSRKREFHAMLSALNLSDTPYAGSMLDWLLAHFHAILTALEAGDEERATELLASYRVEARTMQALGPARFFDHEPDGVGGARG